MARESDAGSLPASRASILDRFASPSGLGCDVEKTVMERGNS
jgi:hypothetical protein